MQILDACIFLTYASYGALFVFFMWNIDEIW